MTDDSPLPPRQARVWLTLGAGGLTLAWLAAAWSRRWIADDGLINARVIDQLLAGNGAVFNLGERVEAATSTAWLWLAAALARVTGQVDGALVYGGLACSVAAVLLALLPRREDGRVTVAPGLLAYLPLSVGWDFATSGLENGLATLWLVALWRVSARVVEAQPRSTLAALCVLLGLGPLVRPEFSLHVGLVAGWWLVRLRSARDWRGLGLVVGLAPLPLVGSTLLRGAYYASLVPNTALAKGAGATAWAEGASYLLDFAGTYHLAVPALALGLLAHGRLVASPSPGPRWRTGVLLAAAGLQALFVVRLGGDFMHGRMLLAPWLLASLALGEVTLEARPPRRPLFALVGLAGWALVAAGLLRFDVEPQRRGPVPIVDERQYYVDASGVAHPTTRADHSALRWGNLGVVVHRQQLRCEASACEPRLAVLEPGDRLVVHPGSGAPGGWRVAVQGNAIGALATLAGSRVHVVDARGLAEPLASRMEATGARAGHRKELPRAWLFARYGSPTEAGPDVEAARAALRCGELAELAEAITAPWDATRAWNNLLLAPRLTRLVVPRDPAEAKTRFCARP